MIKTNHVAKAGKIQPATRQSSPGWINTTPHQYTGADASQHPVGRVGEVADIVHAVLFLCDAKSSFITGQDIIIDGGMSKLMIYHGDGGWIYNSPSS